MDQGLRLLAQALALCRQPGGPAGYEKSLRDDLTALDERRRFQPLRGKRKSDDPELTRQAKALLEKGNVNILGVVLNKVPQRHQGGYYYYYYYDENHEKHKKQKS